MSPTQIRHGGAPLLSSHQSHVYASRLPFFLMSSYSWRSVTVRLVSWRGVQKGLSIFTSDSGSGCICIFTVMGGSFTKFPVVHLSRFLERDLRDQKITGIQKKRKKISCWWLMAWDRLLFFYHVLLVLLMRSEEHTSELQSRQYLV